MVSDGASWTSSGAQCCNTKLCLPPICQVRERERLCVSVLLYNTIYSGATGNVVCLVWPVKEVGEGESCSRDYALSS